MSKHLKIYDKYFDINVHNPRRCEITGAWRKIEVHHIDARGMGGSKMNENIENYIALVKEAHDFFGDIKEYKEWLRINHELYMMDRVPLIERNPDDEILVKFLFQKFGNIKRRN